jgi:hypothetical protein
MAYGIGHFADIMYLTVQHGSGLMACGFLRQDDKLARRLSVSDRTYYAPGTYIKTEYHIFKGFNLIHLLTLFSL